VRSSVKMSLTANAYLLDRTCQVWQPRLRRDLSPEDARQIAENLAGFFELLAEWSRAEASAAASNAQKSAPSKAGGPS